MDIKKEFVQVYGYCVDDGATEELELDESITYVRASDVRRITIYKTFHELFVDDSAHTIFNACVAGNKDTDLSGIWKVFCNRLMGLAGFSCTCGGIKHGVQHCKCDFSVVLPLVEVWTKTGKYFVAGEDRFRFVERK